MSEEETFERELETLVSPYVYLGQNQKGIRITGVALKEGVFKDVLYSEKELKKVANRMKGLPLKVEHGRTKEFGGIEVGKVESSYWDPLLRSILFSAIVTNARAIEYVKSGELGAVSSSTWMEKRSAGHAGLKIGSSYNFQELSLVKQPACDKCFIFHVEQLSNRILGKDLNIKKTQNTIEGELQLTKEDEILEETLLDEGDNPEEELGEVEELTPQLFVILELPDLESLSELKKVYKVQRYYLDYKSPYKNYKKGPEELKEVATKEMKEIFTPSPLGITNVAGKLMEHQKGAPNPEACSEDFVTELQGEFKCKLCDKTHPSMMGFFKHFLAKHQKYYEDEKYKGKDPKEKSPEKDPKEAKTACPVCGDKFESTEEFGKHWGLKHKEKYGEFKETMSLFEEGEELAGEACKVKKMKNGRFIAMKPSGKKFPPFKILGNFATIDEAKKACGGEENQEEDKDKYGCKIGFEQWDPKEEKCIPLPKEEQSGKDIKDNKIDGKKGKEEETLSEEKKPEKVEEAKVEPEVKPEVKPEEKVEPKVKPETTPEAKKEEPVEKVEPKETPGQTITVRLEHIMVPQPKPVVPEVKAETKVEPKVETPEVKPEVKPEIVKTETKEMTEEELLKELKGRGAEIILRSYTRKEK